MSLGEEEWIHNESNRGNKYSTPIANRDNRSDREEKVEVGSVNRSIHASDEFLQWVEQSISVQEELLDEVLNKESRDDGDIAEGRSSSNNSSSGNSISREGGEEMTLSKTDEEAAAFSGFVTATSFSGFEQQDVDFQNKVKTEVLFRMREQLLRTRRGIQRFRSNNLFVRQIWRDRYMQSEDRLEIGSGLESEVSDVLSPLPRMSAYSSECRVTRAMGQAMEHPHVQQSILEYRGRSKRE